MINVEIKAQLRDPGAVEERVAALDGVTGPVVIEQRDYFYRCCSGRLKLRRFPSGMGELIFYDRPDDPGPSKSYYLLAGTDDPDGMDAVLAAALGRLGRVVKTRHLYRLGRTRIHIDRVEELGSFLELELVLDDEAAGAAADEAIGEARNEAMELLERLGISEDDLVEGAYVDYLEKR